MLLGGAIHSYQIHPVQGPRSSPCKREAPGASLLKACFCRFVNRPHCCGTGAVAAAVANCVAERAGPKRRQRWLLRCGACEGGVGKAAVLARRRHNTAIPRDRLDRDDGLLSLGSPPLRLIGFLGQTRLPISGAAL